MKQDEHPGPSHLHEERHRAGRGAQLRNFVFGTSDGLVTVLAFVAGVSASLAQRRLVLLAGVSEMFAGSLSMGLGALLGARAERDLYLRERAREEREIREVPQLERDELRAIYAKKGFFGADLERIVEVLSAEPKRWVDTMMSEELGLNRTGENPTRDGLVVGCSYMIAAAIPLLPYVFFEAPAAFPLSIALTSLALIAVGVAKARFTQRGRLLGALESLAAGLGGTAICWGIGQLIAYLIGRTP